MKVIKLLTAISIALLCFSFVSCSEDDDNGGSPSSLVNETTHASIKQVFPNLRLDSISSYKDYGNIKIVYDGDYLVEYGEYYDTGRIHDGVYYRLKWNKNDVDVYVNNAETPFMKAVFGNNGFVKECLNTDGSIRHTFEYDEDGYLVKYNEDNASRFSTPDYWEMHWENGNMVSATKYFFQETGNAWDGYRQYTFVYTNDENKAGLRPGLRGNDWLHGVSDSEYMVALYYAGILGKGTKNLVESSSGRYDSGQSAGYNKYQYVFNNGIVVSCSGDGTDYYFYK